MPRPAKKNRQTWDEPAIRRLRAATVAEAEAEREAVVEAYKQIAKLDQLQARAEEQIAKLEELIELAKRNTETRPS